MLAAPATPAAVAVVAAAAVVVVVIVIVIVIVTVTVIVIAMVIVIIVLPFRRVERPGGGRLGKKSREVRASSISVNDMFFADLYCFLGQYLCSHNFSHARYDDNMVQPKWRSKRSSYGKHCHMIQQASLCAWCKENGSNPRGHPQVTSFQPVW